MRVFERISDGRSFGLLDLGEGPALFEATDAHDELVEGGEIVKLDEVDLQGDFREIH